jgi:hypothetical protein
MTAIDAFAEGMEPSLESMLHADRPAMNEQVVRTARTAALKGVRVSANRFYQNAKVDPFDHDVRLAKRLRDQTRRWVKEQLKLAARRDRPADRAWQEAGLGFDALMRPPGSLDATDSRVTKSEAAAWAEFSTAMVKLGTTVPPTFREFFAGSPACGLGWRRAGHLLFMAEVKRNQALAVALTLDLLVRLQEAQGVLAEGLGRLLDGRLEAAIAALASVPTSQKQNKTVRSPSRWPQTAARSRTAARKAEV